MPDTESSLQEELTESSLAYIQRRRLKRAEMIEPSFIPWCVLWARLHNHFDTISVIQATRSASGTAHNRIRCTTSGLEWPFHLFSAKGELTFWVNSSVKIWNTVCYKYDQSLCNVLNNVEEQQMTMQIRLEWALSPIYVTTFSGENETL